MDTWLPFVTGPVNVVSGSQTPLTRSVLNCGVMNFWLVASSPPHEWLGFFVVSLPFHLAATPSNLSLTA